MNTPPPGHNANVSLLSGGTEQIHGVMGGGTRNKQRTRKRSRKSRARKQNPVRSRRQKGGKNPFVLGKHHAKPTNIPYINDILTETILSEKVANEITPLAVAEAFETSSQIRQQQVENVNTYISQQIKLWQRYSKEGIMTDGPRIRTINTTVKHTDTATGISDFDRLGCILPNTTKKIIIFPPVSGDKQIYLACLEYLTSKKSITEKDTVVIFSPPMYSYNTSAADNVKNNRDICYHFINIKCSPDTLCRMYAMIEHSGISIHTASLCSPPNTEKYSVPLLEPTYIIYPYIVKKKNTEGDDTVVGGVLFSAAAEDEPILLDSKSYSKIGLIGAVRKGISSVAFAPSNKIDKLLQIHSPQYIRHRFFTNTPERNDVMDFPNNSIHLLTIDDSPIEPATVSEDGDTKFKESNELFLTGVTMTLVPLGAVQYSFRHPKTPEVKLDWENQKFTEDEAQFLNDLNLRTDILDDIYKDIPEVTWQKDLAKHMATIVRSKCFSDSRLILHSDCQSSQKFVANVLNYYIKHSERIKRLEEDEDDAKRAALELKSNRDMQKLNALSSSVIDVTQPNWNKDPFTDGLLRQVSMEDSFNIEYEPAVRVNELNGPTYYRVIQVTNRINNTRRYGYLEYDISGKNLLKEAEQALAIRYKKMKEDGVYPQFIFNP